jgi:acetyl-CoA C-acetyltransferase
VTLDRFCGSGITSVNMAANSIMSGSEDLVIAGGTEMMSMEGRRGEGPFMMDNGNLRLRAGIRNRIRASAPMRWRRWKASRGRTSMSSGLESQKRAAAAIKGGLFRQEPRAGYARTAACARSRGIPAAADHARRAGLA